MTKRVTLEGITSWVIWRKSWKSLWMREYVTSSLDEANARNLLWMLRNGAPYVTETEVH